MTTTDRPLYDAYIATRTAYEDAFRIWTYDDTCDEDDLSAPTRITLDAAEAARDAAFSAWRESEEPRLYRVADDCADWTITATPSTLRDAVSTSVREGDWDLSGGTLHWDGLVTCEDGTEERMDVRVDPPVPKCSYRSVTHHCRECGNEVEGACPDHPSAEIDSILSQHDWQAPHEIVGGLRENPGVMGHGGGVTIHEVCARCGRHRHTDTRAQDHRGRQGLTSISYEPADPETLEWIAENT